MPKTVTRLSQARQREHEWTTSSMGGGNCRLTPSMLLLQSFALLAMYYGYYYVDNGEFRVQLAEQRDLEQTAAGFVSQAENQTQTQTQQQQPMEWWQKPQPLLSDWPELKQRNDLIPILEKLRLKRGIEVGVQKGIFAKKILSTWKSCEEYKLVDLWGKEDNYKEPGKDSSEQKNAHYERTKRVLRPWTERGITEFFVMRSTDAAKQLTDNHFDFIYIDARHDYCAVKEDISHYWPKLRPGGIFAGHDYVDAQYAIDRLGPQEDWSYCEDGSKHPQGVKGAVDDFAKEHGLTVVTSQEDFPTWFLQKPYQ